MKVTINHVQKTTGVIRKYNHHGVSLKVEFNAAEIAIIRERLLERDVVVARDYSADIEVVAGFRTSC